MIEACPVVNMCGVVEIVFRALVTVLLGGALAGLVHICYRRPKFNKQERILTELAEMRTQGTALRNMKPAAASQVWLAIWKEAANVWYEKLYTAAKNFSPVEAERLKTLDRFELIHFGGIIISPDHLHRNSMLSETLRRLDLMLEKRFRPSIAP